MPHTFQNGEVADAEKVNENFEVLSNRIQSIDGSGGRPAISITTDPVITQEYHPFVASITSDTPLYRVGVNSVKDGSEYEILSRTLTTTPTSYVIDDRTLRASIGSRYDLAVHAQTIDGKAAVEKVTVGSTLAIPLGDYIVDPPLIVPDRLSDVPLNCWSGRTISEVNINANFIFFDSPCSNLYYNLYYNLPEPVPPVDISDALGCVSNAPIFSLDDLETYGVAIRSVSSGIGTTENWEEVTTVYTPGNPASLLRTVVEWCQYIPSGGSSPADLQTFSRTYQFNAMRLD